MYALIDNCIPYVYSDGFLNIEEFDGICKGLFRNDHGIVYSLDVHTLEHIFNIFDTKKVCGTNA